VDFLSRLSFLSRVSRSKIYSTDAQIDAVVYALPQGADGGGNCGGEFANLKSQFVISDWK
jgi:hypothetical protein